MGWKLQTIITLLLQKTQIRCDSAPIFVSNEFSLSARMRTLLFGTFNTCVSQFIRIFHNNC